MYYMMNKKLLAAHVADLCCWFALGIVIGHYCL
jgi:hypothetical protein